MQVNGGADAIICPGTTHTMGGTPTATGGTLPYSYLWSPSIGLSSTSVANPIANPSQPTTYYIIVTDAAGVSDTDIVVVDLYSIYADNGGQDTGICIGGSATLGGVWNSNQGGVTFFWSPNVALSSQTAPRPIASPTITTTYSVTITSPNCPSKNFTITVTVNQLPTVTACCATTIIEGNSTVLTAFGASTYVWGPSGALSSPYTASTTAEPSNTTTYYVFGQDDNGCIDWDSLTVTVIPSTELVFYNSFSPNGDGVNDLFYIGNAGKYTTSVLEVYSRTGQLVYSKTGYDNSWDGTNYGDKLPEATYYYIYNPGDGSAIKYGDVTILR